MRTGHKAFMAFIMLAFVIIASVNVAHATNYNKKSKKSGSNPKYASLVMNADTGQIISQQYADKVLHPASLTKMMTMLLAFEALDRGDIRKNTRVRISSRAAKAVPSKLGLPAGSTIKVEDAIYILATKSANDIAIALAEHIGGTESRFANSMTARARTIGMTKTRFKNASGLHNKYQVTTARDMAKLARYILQRHPHQYKYFSTRSFTYKGKTYRNHNRLLESYPGMDGFKTGYINASGFNLVASAHRNGHRLIGVVFGGRSGKTRNAHMASILDKGFRKVGNLRTASITPAPIPKSKPTYGVIQQPQIVQRAATTAQTGTAYASLASLHAKSNTRITAKLPPAPKTKQTVNDNIQPNYTALTAALKDGAFGEMIGEGDFDPSVSKRLETGLIAVAVHKGDYAPNPAPASAVEKSLRAAGHAMVDKMGQSKAAANDINKATAINHQGSPSLPHPKDVVGKWAVQIGAFQSRIKTDDALREAKKKLPVHLNKISAMTVPLNTEKGMIFRARLGGMDESEARELCKYFKDCITVAPIATRVGTR